MLNNRFKECRLAAGLSQKYVAVTLGIKGSSICSWENGETLPNSKNLSQVADLYGVTVDYLLGRSNDKSFPWVREPSETLPKRVPLFGAVAAGKPIYADGDVREYVDAPQADAAPDAHAEAAERRLTALRKQMGSLHDLVESGVYTVQEFVTRRAELQQRIDAAQDAAEKQKNAPSKIELLNANREAIRYVADAYDLAETAEEKNRLLKSVIDHVDYEKTVAATKAQNPTDFLTLTIYPKLVI